MKPPRSLLGPARAVFEPGAPLAAAAALALFCAAAQAGETALDRYIAKPEPAYRWELVRTIGAEDHQGFVLELTSQRWRSEAEVDRTEWKHWLTIIRPAAARPGVGFLFIGGGNNRNPAPTGLSERSLRLAVETGTVVADLGMVPNQPLTFSDAPERGRSEDDLIAYGRVRYIQTGDEEWLVRLPMVKSAVKALDAVQEFLKSGQGGPPLEVAEFVVAGGSKRGWTTWLTGVMDPRVKGIIPMVIDALNTEAITRHHFEAYGFFSSALGDYVRHGLYPHWIGTPQFGAILDVEDPYRYRDRPRLRIPKFLINASGDQYFLPDNSNFYFADMPEPKYLRYVPNTRHSLQDTDARQSLQAFYEALLAGRPLPRFSWTMAADGAIQVTAADAPAEVQLWQATNPEARDFRLDTLGPAWTGRPLEDQGGGRYVGRVEAPPQGWSAYFVELTYPSGGTYPFKFTTDVRVVPDVLPYRWEQAREKYAATAPTP